MVSFNVGEYAERLWTAWKIIFGDEHRGALNSQTSWEIMDLFSDINVEGTAVIIVTHDAKVAARSERIMFMRENNIYKY